MAAHRSARLCADSRITKRHGSVWCGAGAVSAAVIARQTAARLTGSPVNSRMVRRASGTSAAPNRNMSSAGGRISAAAPGPSSAVTRSASPRTTATGTPERLALDQVRGGGDLVGDRVQGDLQRVAEAVLGAPVVDEGPHARGADRGVGLADPPRPAERVGDDDPDGGAGPVAQRLAEPPRGLVRVLGQQHHRARRGVGGVDTRRGEHQALPGLDDAGVAAPRDHPDRLSVDRGLAVAVDDPALRLAHDLRRDHDDVAVSQVIGGVRDQRGQVRARLDLREPGNAPDADLAAGALPGIRRAPRPGRAPLGRCRRSPRGHACTGA